MAEKSLFINIARVAWGFNIAKKVDENGVIIEPDASMMPGWMTIPGPFVCDLTVRSEGKKALIETVWDEARKGLKAGADDKFGVA